MTPTPTGRTHCPSGHPFDRENTVRKKQGSGYVYVCLTCRREQSKQAARRRRAREKEQRG